MVFLSKSIYYKRIRFKFEVEKIAIIHLFTLGFRGDDLLSFKLSLNNPSKIAELQELEHWKSKFDIECLNEVCIKAMITK